MASEQPEKNGSKSWERYERYKKSMTIRQALKNGCTWLDLQFDHAHGNLKIKAAAPVTDNDSKNKKRGPKLKRGIPIQRASSGQRARTGKDQHPPVSLQCEIRCNGISRGYDTNTRRYRGDGTKETHIRIAVQCHTRPHRLSCAVRRAACSVGAPLVRMGDPRCSSVPAMLFIAVWFQLHGQAAS